VFEQDGLGMQRWAELREAKIWYRTDGVGEPVLLLHGGLTDSRDFAGNLDRLSKNFRIYLPDRRAHGRSPDVEGPLTIEVMAADMEEFVETVVGGAAHVVGYSVGASVATYLAMARPDLARSLVAISGALSRDGWLVRPQAGDPPEPLLRAYAEVSPDGPQHFRVVIEKASAASEESGRPPTDLKAFAGPALVIVADDDFVDLRHAVDIYEALPDAALAVLPGASHLLLQEQHVDAIVDMVGQFLTNGHRSTLLPIRRPGRGRPG
jgi:pimeloyl-ACP methyl ester carboxylesterase